MSEENGERLREAACVGDLELITRLVCKPDFDINSKNQINGWTPLHWACKRNHVEVVRFLLGKGADVTLKNIDGNVAAQLTANTDIRQLLGADPGLDVKSSQLPITPNYIANPPFPYASPTTNGQSPKFNQTTQSQSTGAISQAVQQEIVLKARLANCEEKDFIEIELERSSMTFANLLNLMCAELGVDKKLVAKVRKLPDTIVRKDKDVSRLRDFQELELCLTNKAMSAASRTYNVGPANNHETILY